MYKYIIISLLFIVCSRLYASEVNTDSTIINIRIEKALEVVRNDPKFLEYMKNRLELVSTFKVDDTLHCPYIGFSIVKQLYPDSSDLVAYNLYNSYMDCFTKYEKRPIVKISNIYKDSSSTFHVYIGMVDWFSQEYLILQEKPKTELEGMYQVYFVFDDKNNVLRYLSGLLTVTE